MPLGKPPYYHYSTGSLKSMFDYGSGITKVHGAHMNPRADTSYQPTASRKPGRYQWLPSRK